MIPETIDYQRKTTRKPITCAGELNSISHSIYHVTSLHAATGSAMLKSETHNDLSHQGILDMAVDGTKLLTKVLSLVDHLVKGDLRCTSSSVVATVGNNLGVVGGATAVPGKELKEMLTLFFLLYCGQRRQLTLGVSDGMSSRAPLVAMLIRSFLSFAGVMSATAKAESLDGWRETK